MLDFDVIWCVCIMGLLTKTETESRNDPSPVAIMNIVFNVGRGSKYQQQIWYVRRKRGCSGHRGIDNICF